MINDYIKSAEIIRKTKEFGKGLVKKGVRYLDIAEKIEEKIIELGGKPAFPVDVSVNHIAAHDSPLYNDKRVIKKGDLVKLDIGVHVNGKVTDTAYTIEVDSNRYKSLIESVEEALKIATKICKPGVKVRKIGKAIQETIVKYGFSPIKNLGGHGVDDYEIHCSPSIPNFDNGNETVLKKGDVIAIEPFATTGEGKVKDGRLCEVYQLVNLKNIRDVFSREVLKFINEEYKTLPFCARWLIKRFGLRVKLTLKQLELNGIIKQHHVLPEVSNGMVAQAEHTLVVGGEILT